jgi:tetratricopeptide (TPR) repeat protein
MFPAEVRALLAAADEARTGGAADRAVDRYTEALDVVGEDERGRRSIRLLRGLALVEMEDFDGGARELRELLPNLEGREHIEALLGLGRASMWMEQTDEALGLAERVLELADRLDDREMRGPALALLSHVHGQRGHEGDLGLAVELGDQALQVWVPGTRSIDLATHESLHALNHYWVGRYAEAAELGRRGGDGATEGLALTALGRHEDALDVFDAAIAQQREANATIGTAYALNCSTAALRDLLDLSEARHRNGEANELFGRAGFESGVMQGEIDLLYADLLDDAVAEAERAWPVLWERARDATGWERWLAPGRLAVARAQIALRAERPERLSRAPSKRSR